MKVYITLLIIGTVIIVVGCSKPTKKEETADGIRTTEDYKAADITETRIGTIVEVIEVYDPYRQERLGLELDVPTTYKILVDDGLYYQFLITDEDFINGIEPPEKEQGFYLIEVVFEDSSTLNTYIYCYDDEYLPESDTTVKNDNR
jgi:hypothetical protein